MAKLNGGTEVKYRYRYQSTNWII